MTLSYATDLNTSTSLNDNAEVEAIARVQAAVAGRTDVKAMFQEAVQILAA